VKFAVEQPSSKINMETEFEQICNELTDLRFGLEQAILEIAALKKQVNIIIKNLK